MPRQRVDQRRAVGVVMQQQDRMRAAGLAIGREQRAQLADQRIGRRQRIGGGAGRAGGGALSAAGADVGIDQDVIAVRRDRAGRAKVEAARAAHDLRARMRAQVLGEFDVARLVERAGEIGGTHDGAQHRGGIVRVGAHITIAQIVCGEERRAAREVEHDVAARGGAVAARTEHERGARRRRGGRVVVDHQLEGAEITFRVAQRALDDRKLGEPRRRDLIRIRQHHRDVELVLEQRRRFDRARVAAVDEGNALALHADVRRRWHGLGRHREQRRHLRARRLRVCRPAAGLAHVDEGDLGALGPFARDLGEQRGLLRAADRYRSTGSGRFPEALDLGAAQLACALHVRAARAALHGVEVERHRVFAGADEGGAAISHQISRIRAVFTRAGIGSGRATL